MHIAALLRAALVLSRLPRCLRRPTEEGCMHIAALLIAALVLSRLLR